MHQHNNDPKHREGVVGITSCKKTKTISSCLREQWATVYTSEMTGRKLCPGALPLPAALVELRLGFP